MAPEFETAQIRNEFNRNQWKFPPVFVKEKHLELPGNAPLPFSKKEYKAHGSFGHILKVEVSPGHVRGLDKDYAALKVIRESRGDSWDKIMREAETLRNREHNNIVPLLAAFTVEASGSDERSLNILFPWADMNMEQWLGLDSSPLDKCLDRKGQREWLYRETHALVSAVSYLHRDIDGQITSHHDLKPENILWLEGSLKICDLGRSHLLQLAEGSETEGKSGLGTFRYQPPEYYNDDGTRSARSHGRAFDVWSPGCIVVEMAILIVHGWDRRKIREFAEARAKGRNRRRDFSKKKKPDDSFHNNVDVVRKWISDMKVNESRNLAQTLSVAEKMLTEDLGERIFSWEANLDLHEILYPDDPEMEHISWCIQPPKQEKASRVRNPLHRAVENGNLKLVAKLVASGWPVNGRDASGLSPVQLALYGRHSLVIEFLASQGAKMDFKTPSGSSPLQWTEAANKANLARIPFQRIPDLGQTFCETSQYGTPPTVNAVTKDEFGKTAVHRAAEEGQMNVLRDSLRNSDNRMALILDRDGNGLTPLHWAAKAGCFEAAACLLDFEAAQNTIWWRDNFNKTPLHYASDAGAQDVVSLLLERCDQPELLLLAM